MVVFLVVIVSFAVYGVAITALVHVLGRRVAFREHVLERLARP